jgi:amino acid transporter
MQTLLAQLPNGSIAVGAVLFNFVFICIAIWFFRKQMGEEWKQFLKDNYVIIFGIPFAATAAFGLVIFFGVTTPGPIDLDIWSLKLNGPAGPLTMWVVVFLSLVLGIWVIRPRS